MNSSGRSVGVGGGTVGVGGGVGVAAGVGTGVGSGVGGGAGGGGGVAVAGRSGISVGIAVGGGVGAIVGWGANGSGGVAVGAAVSKAAGGSGRLNIQAARKMMAARPAPTATIICCRKVAVGKGAGNDRRYDSDTARRGGNYQDCGATAGRVSVKAVCWPAAGAGTEATRKSPP